MYYVERNIISRYLLFRFFKYGNRRLVLCIFDRIIQCWVALWYPVIENCISKKSTSLLGTSTGVESRLRRRYKISALNRFIRFATFEELKNTELRLKPRFAMWSAAIGYRRTLEYVAELEGASEDFRRYYKQQNELWFFKWPQRQDDCHHLLRDSCF